MVNTVNSLEEFSGAETGAVGLVETHLTDMVFIRQSKHGIVQFKTLTLCLLCHQETVFSVGLKLCSLSVQLAGDNNYRLSFKAFFNEQIVNEIIICLIQTQKTLFTETHFCF